MIKLGIVGSRSFTDYDKLRYWMDNLFTALPVNTVVSGGASGADTLARQYAKDNGLKLIEYQKQHKIYGAKAGVQQVFDIVQASNIILCFWDGRDKRSKMILDYAKTRMIPTVIIYV